MSTDEQPEIFFLTSCLLLISFIQIVQGLDMALPLMLVGEKAEVQCDARFAYGTLGLKNEENTTTIPPASKVKINRNKAEIIQIDV